MATNLLRYTTGVIVAVVISFLFMSCEKAVFDDDIENRNDKGGNLTLKVITANHDFQNATRGDVSYWQRLCFVVYKDGTKVKSITQTADEDGYGEATMQLSPDTYQVLVLAHSSSSNPTLTTPEKLQFTNAMGYTDTFYYYGDIIVTSTPQTHSVELKRATAMLRFIINDTMPATVKSLRLYFTGGSGALNAKTGMGCVDSKQTVNFDTNPSDGAPYVFETYTIPKEAKGSLNITITAFDNNGGVVVEKTVKGVEIERNKITELAGELFNGNGGSGGGTEDGGGETPTSTLSTFLITANTEWGGTITQAF